MTCAKQLQSVAVIFLLSQTISIHQISAFSRFASNRFKQNLKVITGYTDAGAAAVCQSPRFNRQFPLRIAFNSIRNSLFRRPCWDINSRRHLQVLRHDDGQRRGVRAGGTGGDVGRAGREDHRGGRSYGTVGPAGLSLSFARRRRRFHLMSAAIFAGNVITINRWCVPLFNGDAPAAPVLRRRARMILY